MVIKKVILVIVGGLLVGLAIGWVVYKKDSGPVISPLGRTTPTLTPPPPTPTEIPKIRLGLVGDLGLGRHITSTARVKNNFGWSFEEIGNWLRANDINIANLESPIIKNCPEGKTGTFTFCGDERFLPELKKYNFLFNLANNHIFNYQQSGFKQTEQFLKMTEIPFVYSHRTDDFIIKEIKGIKIGMLGFNLLANESNTEARIIEKIYRYDPMVDWLIVSIHWGNEYLPKPEEWRVKLAHQMIEAGADIIHGHHPHVWQPEEIYQGKYIFYSLGNFIFDQSWSKETSETNIINLTITKDKVLEMRKTPVEIKFNSQPRIKD